jgi:hypothetical protein
MSLITTPRGKIFEDILNYLPWVSLVIICPLLSCSGPKRALHINVQNQIEDDPPALLEDVEHIRMQLGWDDPEAYWDGLKYLNQLGEKKVFSAFEAILSKPKDISEVLDIFGVLRDLQGDRSRFIEYAVRGLTYTKDEVRFRAVELLEVIGTTAESPPVIALLSDESTRAVKSAARTLVAIGGERELIAMDVWLQGASHRDDADLRQRVKKSRDALQKRLDEEHAKQKK